MRFCVWPRTAELDITPAVAAVLEPQLEVWRRRRVRGQQSAPILLPPLLVVAGTTLVVTNVLHGLAASSIAVLACCAVLVGVFFQTTRDENPRRAPWKYLLRRTAASTLGTSWLQDPVVRQILLSGELNDDTEAMLVALAPDFHGSVAKLESTVRHLDASEYRSYVR